MAAGVEDGVELRGAVDQVRELVGRLPDGLLLLQEGLADGVVLLRLDGGGVQRGDAAGGGGED